MKNIKLIATDMDGTLLNSKKEITAETMEAIKYARSKGIIFTVSTGRPLAGVSLFKELLDFEMPAITYNGAVIINSLTKEIIYSQTLDGDDVRKIFEYAKFFEVTHICWAKDHLFVSEFSEKTKQYQSLSGVELEEMPDVEELVKMGVTKIIFIDEVEKIKKYNDYLAKEYVGNASFMTSQPIFLEFFSNKVSKAKAMEKLGEIYKIAPDEMMAIGDGMNDLSMLNYAYYSVAMGNAASEVKAACRFETLTNDENGVASAIYRYCRQ
ncbi:MAG: Cof-type HAD-IIB family hydrolase [Lachnospiraceae bacterium]|nr:Cof-type HAD-IIB family hydrolase [Lachnospiraceae bacterium]